ncbi:MAG: hypothetical protein JW860_00610, partial [Sedimentisphaerales bacterium]|nr:hypothetical protein [Sedimentisphaerales bacterium]
GKGTISPAGTTLALDGDSITFTATANDNYQVDHWEVDGITVQTWGSSYTLSNVIADHTVHVSFKPKTGFYHALVSSGTGGSIDPNGLVTIVEGEDQTFTAIPDNGYVVDDWSINGTVVQAGGQTYILQNVSGDYIVAVTFQEQLIEVQYPNGGELLLSENAYELIWTSDASIEGVVLEYSLDAGATWSDVDAQNTGNDGSYEWEVPAVESDQCLVRVSDANDPTMYDVSDVVFTVAPLSASQLLFRDNMDSSWGGYVHVGFYPGYDKTVMESYGGYLSGLYVDPNGGFVSISTVAGVQQQSTVGSFLFNKLDSDANSLVSDTLRVPIQREVTAAIEDFINSRMSYGYCPATEPAYKQKGFQNRYSAAGLIEAAAEYAQVAGGQGYIPDDMEAVYVPEIFSGLDSKTLAIGTEIMNRGQTWDGKQWIIVATDLVDFIIEDPQGRRIGHVDGITYDEIPGAYYSGNADNEMVLIPDRIEGDYYAVVYGIGADYKVLIAYKDEYAKVKTQLYEGYLNTNEEFSDLIAVPYCDLNGDHIVSVDDLFILSEQWLTEKVTADFDPENHFVGLDDWVVLAKAWQSTREPLSINWNPLCDIAPAEGDGVIDAEDLDAFLSQWLLFSAYSADIAPIPDGDGFVDMLDFVVFAESWMTSIEMQ